MCGCIFFHSMLNFTDGDNIKNFLSGLEDGSASTSDKDSSVFVFLANFATELWYFKVMVDIASTHGILYIYG